MCTVGEPEEGVVVRKGRGTTAARPVRFLLFFSYYNEKSGIRLMHGKVLPANKGVPMFGGLNEERPYDDSQDDYYPATKTLPIDYHWVATRGWLGKEQYELRHKGALVLTAQEVVLAVIPYTEPKVRHTVYWYADDGVPHFHVGTIDDCRAWIAAKGKGNG